MKKERRKNEENEWRKCEKSNMKTKKKGRRRKWETISAKERKSDNEK